jgi:hypothetical protein
MSKMTLAASFTKDLSARCRPAAATCIMTCMLPLQKHWSVNHCVFMCGFTPCLQPCCAEAQVRRCTGCHPGLTHGWSGKEQGGRCRKKRGCRRKGNAGGSADVAAQCMATIALQRDLYQQCATTRCDTYCLVTCASALDTTCTAVCSPYPLYVCLC